MCLWNNALYSVENSQAVQKKPKVHVDAGKEAELSYFDLHFLFSYKYIHAFPLAFALVLNKDLKSTNLNALLLITSYF